MIIPTFQIEVLAESAVCVSFDNMIDEQLNGAVRVLSDKINDTPFSGFIEAVPGYASLAIYFDLSEISKPKEQTAHVFVKETIEKMIAEIQVGAVPTNESVVTEIPVKYDGEDLDYVCSQTGLSKYEVVELHTSPLYRVYMMGFLPGFAYLGGMDKRLAVPRRKTPRLTVPAGSVGIAGEQTGVYPLDSPGGWQLIGRTEKALFLNNNEGLTLLKQGDCVRFVAVG